MIKRKAKVKPKKWKPQRIVKCHGCKIRVDCIAQDLDDEKCVMCVHGPERNMKKYCCQVCFQSHRRYGLCSFKKK